MTRLIITLLLAALACWLGAVHHTDLAFIPAGAAFLLAACPSVP